MVGDYRQCEHGLRVPRWGISKAGKFWAHYACPSRKCDPVWENRLERIYDAWAARMQDEIHSLRPEAATVPLPAWESEDDEMLAACRAEYLGTAREG